VREQHGLAYSVYSGVDAFRDAGCLSIYLAVSNKRARKAIELVLREIRTLKDSIVSAEELRATKDQLRTAILLNLDSVTSRMSSLAQHEIIFGRNIPFDEFLAGIEQVSAQNIQTLAREIFQPDSLMIAILGAGGKLKLDRKHLNC
jgi:predicted Zn-dependent peptidase